ncbi:MAG: hypothetical protein PVH82_10715 [Desulfobacteraceae bacterium]|jgi:hypothetical protein
MNTQSHAVLTFYLLRQMLGKRLERIKNVNPVLFSGAIVPDVAIFVFFVWYTLIDPTSQRVMWSELAFLDEWQFVFSLFHSLPLWAFASVGLLLLKMPRGALFCLAALVSAIQDLFVHHDDGHAHFFPFSDYRFESPFSYWDPAHYGWHVSVAELILVLAASVWTFRRLQTRWGKGLLVVSAVSLAATQGFWAVLFTFF